MFPKDNVIDLAERRLHKKRQKSAKSLKSGKAPVVDITERRQEMIQSERRQVKRTILTEFIGACVVVPNHGLMKVALYDISDNGIAFDMEKRSGSFQVGEEIAVRVYLNHTTYFGFIVKVQNVRSIEDEDILRLGANFMQDTVNDKALKHFVKFIESVSASLERDTGDVMVSNLDK